MTGMKTEKMLGRQDHEARVKRRKMQDGIENESASSVSEFKKKFQDALLAVENFDRKSLVYLMPIRTNILMQFGSLLYW